MRLSTLSQDNFFTNISQALEKAYGTKSRVFQPNKNIGADAGSAVAAKITYPAGLPKKLKHRRYFAITPPNA